MRTVILFFFLVVGVAAVSALATRYLINQTPRQPGALHDWLHAQLDLTDEQLEALEKIEATFAVKETPLREAFTAANRDLAIVIREEGAYTSRVSKAVENVHQQMGELQKISIAHLFEMTTVLEPEQKNKLMTYAEMALTDTL
jgi:Spy/CpxP family protein refolding chaperone